MNPWESDLDDLKRKAIANTIEDPIAYNARLEATLKKRFAAALQGCTLDDPTEKLTGRLLGALRADPRLFDLPKSVVCGWQLRLSRWRELPMNTYKWRFSAVSWPRGRTPAQVDLEILDQIVCYVMPQPRPVAAPENPAHARHWTWLE